MRTVQVLPSSSRGYVELAFPHDPAIVNVVRALGMRRWDRDRRRWLVAGTEIEHLTRELGHLGVGLITATVTAASPESESVPVPAPRSPDGSRWRRLLPALPPARAVQFEAVERELKLRRYSPRTRRAYGKLLRRFLLEMPAGDYSADAIRAYGRAFWIGASPSATRGRSWRPSASSAGTC
jgi:hypothetical protein